MIVCVECGGRAHLLQSDEELGTYRCEDCMDRFDLLFPDDEDAAGEEGG